VTLGEGEAVAAIGTTPDAQNNTLIATVQGWTAGNIPTNTEGYQLLNVSGSGPYYSKWTYNTNTAKLKALWEYVKEITSHVSPEVAVYGMSGDLFLGITHQVTITSPSGTFIQNAILTFTGGTGILLAIDSVTAGTKIWMQLITGVAPTTGTITGAGGGSATIGTVTSKTVPKVFVGSYTGTLIGAYGVGVDPDDLTAADTVQDLLDNTKTPPNNVTFTVSGLIDGEDYVLVGPKGTGTTLKLDQLTLNGALIGATVEAVVVNEAIPADTPSPTGTIRIELDTGVYRLIPYLSWSGSTFVIASTSFVDPNDAANGNNVFISYIDRICDADTEAFTGVYKGTPTDLFIRVRDGGGAGKGNTPIKTFESAGSLGAAGGGAVASRINDF
jgi:hypothetical protein